MIDLGLTSTPWPAQAQHRFSHHIVNGRKDYLAATVFNTGKLLDQGGTSQMWIQICDRVRLYLGALAEEAALRFAAYVEP